MSTKISKVVFSTMCLVMMFAPMIGAAAEEDSGVFSINDFIKPSSAKAELNDSAFSGVQEKGSNWGTIALVAVIVIYFGGCLYRYYTGDDDARATAFKGMFLGVVVVVLFMACTSTALDALSWDY